MRSPTSVLPDVRSRKAEQFHPDPPSPATDQEKYLYVQRRYYLIILISVFSFSGIALSQVRFALQSPALWGFLVITVILAAYYVISLLVNVGTFDFNVAMHNARVDAWRPSSYASIDVWLPVCGEPLEVINNTWKYVSQLAWPGVLNIYCLDDADDPKVKALAAQYGFHYLVRDDRPRMQKAGNIQNGFRNSNGDFILIFDADFCPRTDMLTDLMPYFDDAPDLGILQTPQYFRVTNQQGWLERGAGAVQELFYRVVQQSREQRNAAICVGTNAIYRRAALEQNGGPTQIGHSEDVHTGFDLRRLGWRLMYIPIVYAVGICPSLRSAFLAQQYRWCMGSMSLLGSKKFWQQKMPLRSRFGYFSGFGYYVTTAMLTIVGPLTPLVLLLFYPHLVLLSNYAPILVSIAYTLVVIPLWHQHRYRLDAFATRMIYGWAHLFALTDILRGQRKAWSPTGAGSTGKKTTKAVLTRNFNLGITLWGGGTALLWLGSAIYRFITMPDHENFVPMILLGGFYALTVFKCMTPSVPSTRGTRVNRHVDDDIVHIPDLLIERSQ